MTRYTTHPPSIGPQHWTDRLEKYTKKKKRGKMYRMHLTSFQTASLISSHLLARPSFIRLPPSPIINDICTGLRICGFFFLVEGGYYIGVDLYSITRSKCNNRLRYIYPGRGEDKILCISFPCALQRVWL